jgi:hypothetical protein
MASFNFLVKTKSQCFAVFTVKLDDAMTRQENGPSAASIANEVRSAEMLALLSGRMNG